MKNRLVDIIFNNIKIVFLLFLFLVIFGASSLSQMQRQGFPDVLVNIVSVQVLYPNASAEQIENDILKPIEGVLSDLESVTEYETIASDSFAMAIVTFDQKADLNEAFAEMKNEIISVDYPEDAQEPVIEKFSVAGPGEFIVAVTGFEDAWDLYLAGNDLQEELGSVSGVKQVTPTNAITPEVNIDFRLDDLEAHELTRTQVEGIIKTSQFGAPVGSFESDEESISVILKKELTSLEDIRNIIVADGVLLKDVADVDDSLNNNGHYNRIGFRRADNIDSKLYVERALLYAVKIEKDADILLIEDEINALLLNLEEEKALAGTQLEKGSNEAYPEYVMVYSQGESTRLQIEEITQSIFGKSIESLGILSFLGYLAGGLGLVVLLLFVFMNLRIALLAALAIPLSLFFAAIYLNFVGIDLNTLVLFSMVLTIGLVVDPTIVFLESMQRYKMQGFNGKEAAAKTMSTVGLGVFLAVATNILVFVPFGIVSGFFGEIIKYIPATVIPAMIASMLIPVIFFMPLASKLLSSKRKEKDNEIEQLELIGTWPLARAIGRAIKWILGPGKAKIVLRFAVFLLIIGAPIATGYALISSGAIEVVQFSTQEDSEFMIITGDITDEWIFEKAVAEIIIPIQNELTNHPEIKNFSFFEQGGNSFMMLVQLLPIDVREDKELRTSDEVAAAINESIEKLNLDADVEASTEGEGPPQDEFPIRVRLLDSDLDNLHLAADDIKNYLESVEGVNRIEDNISDGNSGGSITFALNNEESLAQNPFIVFSLLNEPLASNELGDIEIDGELFEIISAVDPEITSAEELMDIRVITMEEIIYEQTLAALIEQEIENPEELLEKPEPTYISSLINEATVKESQSIRRINGDRYVEVFATVNEDADALKIQADLEEYLNEDKLAEFNLSENAADFKGSADSIGESFNDLFLALGIAIFLIYVLLVGFFRSYLEPFIILFAIPLGLIGVFLAVFMTTGQLGFLELLGVVAMAGIVVNVTILLIDFANQLKREGKTPEDAISTSVAVRFRPIILTQLTAFGSLIPLVYLSPFWKGLAAAIIFGIVTSALLSLFLTPILYIWSNTITRNVSRIPNGIKWIGKKIKREKKIA